MTMLPIDPSELIPHPGARQRIWDAGKAYQARLPEPPAKVTLPPLPPPLPPPPAIVFHVPSPAWAEATFCTIIKEVATKHEVTVAEICGRGRRQKQTLARWEACWRLYTERQL